MMLLPFVAVPLDLMGTSQLFAYGHALFLLPKKH